MFETLKSDVSSRLYDATLPSESVAATVPTVTATVSITVDDVLPSAPRNVVLTPGNAQINVAWTAPEHNGGASIDAYRVRHRTTAAAASWNYSAPLTVSPYIIERLDNGTVYEVEVQARNSLQPPEFGHWSDVETTTPVAPTLPSVAAPGAPSKAGATSSSITVSWSAVTGAAKYQVRYKTGTNDWTTVEVAAATRYTAQMLDASTTYRFEVSAYGDGATRRAGWGAWSMHLDASSDAAPTMSGCTTTLGSISGTSTLQGTWTDECVSSNRRGTRYARYFTFELATAAELTIELVSEIDPYLYLMAGAGTSGTELAKNDDSRDFAFGYSDSRITYEAAAGTYTAEATTYPATSTGDFTIRIDALSEPTEPTIVQATPGDGEIVVTWNEPDRTGGAAITDYQVQYGTAASGQARSVTDPSINWRLAGWQSASSARTKTIAGLTNGTTYYVAVQARNDVSATDGDGALSEPITAVPVAQVTNTPPRFLLPSYAINVSEDTPSGGSVGLVAATDDDMDTLAYSIGGTTIFAINPGNGNITAAQSLAGLGGTTYTMTVTVTDNVNTPVTVDVEITVDLGAYPTLSAPDVSEGEDGGSIDVSFILPHRGFNYRLVLYRSEDGDTFAQHWAVVELSYGATSPHNFGMLDRSVEGWYRAGSKACRDETDQQCGTEVESNIFTFPTPSVTISGLVSTYDNSIASDDFEVAVADMTSDVQYKVEVSSNHAEMGFNSDCSLRSVERTVPFGDATYTYPTNNASNTLYFCGPVSHGALIAKVKRGESVASSESFTISVAPDAPANVVVNGDNRDVSTTNRWLLKVGWNAVPGGTQYRVFYREECYTNPDDMSPSQMEQPWDCDTGTSPPVGTWRRITVNETTANSDGRIETTIPALRRPSSSRVLHVAIKSLAGDASSLFSESIIGFPTDGNETLPLTIATVPIQYFWSTQRPSYELVFCQETLNQASASTWKNLIVNGMNTWVNATSQSSFWHGGRSTLLGFSGRDDAAPLSCDPGIMDDPNVSEAKILSEADTQTKCNPTDPMFVVNGCAGPANFIGTKKLATVDLTFRDNLSLTDMNSNGQCLSISQTVTHEAGHAFGLGHSHVRSSQMTEIKNDRETVCGITQHDIAAIVALYQSQIGR